MPPFGIVTGREVHAAVFADIDRVLDVVRAAYLAHSEGGTVNPESTFLRFPSRPSDRIIALPAHIKDFRGVPISGIKWVSSFPKNIDVGLPRASAVIVLNDAETGFPRACLEGSVINAARTAASAILAASALSGDNRTARLGIVGCGQIGRYIAEFFLASGWRPSSLHLHDEVHAYACKFANRYLGKFPKEVRVERTPESVLRNSDIAIFSTTAAQPYFKDRKSLEHNPLVLHISLRDLTPDLILAAHNVVDDVDHCLRANTSLHLAEQIVKRRDFVQFTLPAILSGGSVPNRSKPVIFSPFGMGILDVALAHVVFQQVSGEGQSLELPGFFLEP